jgi:hypothetical protein
LRILEEPKSTILPCLFLTLLKLKNYHKIAPSKRRYEVSKQAAEESKILPIERSQACFGFCLKNKLFAAPQSGHFQSSGSCSKGVPAGTPCVGSPFSGT